MHKKKKIQQFGSYENAINEVIGGSSREPEIEENTKISNILFDGKQSSGTITFENCNISDYEQYEFIFGLQDEPGTGEARMFSSTVSKHYLQIPIVNGDVKFIQGGTLNGVVINVDDVGTNYIKFKVNVYGSGWSGGNTGYIYKIIGFK